MTRFCLRLIWRSLYIACKIAIQYVVVWRVVTQVGKVGKVGMHISPPPPFRTKVF
jgi:hypothetical protein